ncbi:MAG: TldD/PmbA family protein [FCB group bacterium]|nr:TldD/PmbA family protein [FCB group bacterium]
MEKLLEMAAKVCDRVELHELTEINDTVTYKKSGLDSINSKSLSGICLRIIKDGRLGYAYTRNLIDREELLNNGLASLDGGVRADYTFPHTTAIENLETCDRSFDNLSGSSLVEECRRISDLLQAKSDSDITVMSQALVNGVRVLNSVGTDLSFKSGQHWMFSMLSLPGSMLGILRLQRENKITPLATAMTDEMLELYGKASKVAKFKPGKMKALFTPPSMVTFTWRIKSGASARCVHEGISPLIGRIGEKVFDNKITIIDNPLDVSFAGARPFDDEGTACRPLTIFENGVFKNIYCDLNYGHKLGMTSTGHGFKTEPLFKFSDPLTLRPIPSPAGMTIQPGNSSFLDMVMKMDRGIIVDNIQGAHSGNIPNGDFSVGVPSGFYVEQGEIVGRIKDTMVAGNIYNIMNRVVDIGSTLHPCWEAWTPAVLFDQVSVSTKE